MPRPLWQDVKRPVQWLAGRALSSRVFILKFSTKAIHAGQEPEPITGAVIPPLFQTTTYAQSGLGEHNIYDYTRTANPTRTPLETCIASLEGGQYGLAFASGMAAMTAILSLLKAGDHIISCDDVYGGSYRLLYQRHTGKPN